MTLGQIRSLVSTLYCRRRWAAGIVLVLSAIAIAQDMPASRSSDALLTPPRTQPATGPATQPAIVDFQPGVRIDWKRRQVLVEGEIVLRQGALELFACSPQTREHESIVRVDARPLHIYQALGLIGLEPGEPSHYTDDVETYHPATGAPVDIKVRYTRQGEAIQHPIEEWMRNARDETPLDPQPWVFAGSFTMDGAFAADPEGTVVAVVDFPSAIIALPRYHSASNEALWLEPQTDRIPSLGSACTLVFSAGPIVIGVDRQGRYLLHDQPALLNRITELLKKHAADESPHPVHLEIHAGAPPSRVRTLRDVIDLLDLPIEETATQPAQREEPAHDSRLVIPWIQDMLARGNPESNASTTQPSSVVSPGPSTDLNWFAKSAQVVDVAAEDFLNRYWPYSSTSPPGGAPPPTAGDQGD